MVRVREIKKKPRPKPVGRFILTHTRLLMFWTFVKAAVTSLLTYAAVLWQHNPLSVILRRQRRMCFVENYEEVMIKPGLKERVLDVFLSDYRRRQRLLNWVHNKSRNSCVTDFSTSWQDGIALCALLESICPGVCPSYHLLTSHNRVKNCRLGLKLANKYLYVPMDLISPEEISIAHKSSESKMIQYISMLRWASQNIKEKWSSLHESLIAAKTGKCFAKGSGLRNGIVSKRSKFTIVVSDTIGVFNMLVEIRGPNNEYCGERLVSLHQAKGVLDKSFDANKTYSDTINYLEDGAGNTFVRKKVPPRYTTDTSDMIHLDFQCGEEGTFYVTFVPRHAGLHNVAVKWQNHHVENSPFRIKVYKASNVSTKSLKGAQEKRVIYDSLSFTSFGSGSGSQDSLDNVDFRGDGAVVMDTENKAKRSLAAAAKSQAYGMGRQLTVTRRRMLRRIITRNGEDIVIEEAISPSMSRQSSFTDPSDDDYRIHRKERADRRLSDNVIMNSQSPNQSDTTAAVSLRTVPEESQNSNESNSTSDVNDLHAQKDIKTKTITLETDSYKCVLPTTTVTNFDLSKSDAKENTSYESVALGYTKSYLKETTPCISVEKVPDTDNGSVMNKCPADAGQANRRAAETEQSRWFKNKDSSGQRTKPPLMRTVSIHKSPARRTKSDGPLLELRREQLDQQIYGEKQDTGSDLSSDDEETSDAEDDRDLSSPSLKVIHSSSLKKMCMYITDKTAGKQFRHSFDDSDVMFDTHNVDMEPKTKLGAAKSLPIMRKMWQKDGTGDNNWISYDFGMGIRNMKPSTFEMMRQENCMRENTVEHNARSSLDILENIMTVDEDGIVSMSRYEYVDDPNIGSRRRKSQAEIHTEMCNAFGLVTTNENGVDDNERNKESVSSGSGFMDDSADSGKDIDGESGNADVFDNLRKETDTFETAIKELECFASVKKEPFRRHQNSKYAIVPAAVDVKQVTKPRRNLIRQWTVFGNPSSSSSTSESTEKRSRHPRKKVKSLETVGSMESLSGLKFEFKPVLQGTNMPSRSEIIKERVDDVCIATPKAKVDKSTQVSEDEIKKETGWDMIERMNLLLRKISIKVPYAIGEDIDNAVTNINVDSSFKSSEDKSEAAALEIDTHHPYALNQAEEKQLNKESIEILSADFAPTCAWLDDGSSMSDSKQKESDSFGHHRGTSLGDSKLDETTEAGTDAVPDTGSSLNDSKQDDTSVESQRRRSDGNLLRVDSWLASNDLSLMNMRRPSPLRQLTAETNDSGFDDNPVYNRQARFSLPSLRSVNGHIRLHRRPYRGQIPLDRKLVVSSSQSMSLERRELGHEADDELVQNNSSLELNNNNNRQQRRRHRLRDRQESVSMSDSEINHQRRHTNKRKVFQNKRYPAHGGVGNAVKRRGRIQAQFISGNGACKENEDQSNSNENHVGALLNDTIENMYSSLDPQLGSLNADEEEDAFDGENNAFDGFAGTTSQIMKAKKVLSNKKSLSSSHSKSQSSIDSNYRGFGISKRGREVLMSQIGDFQSLFPTAENPDEEAMFLETSHSLVRDDRVRDFAIIQADNEEIYDAVDDSYDPVSDEDPCMNDCADAEELCLEDRSQSLDGLLSDASLCGTEHNEDVGTPDTNLSLLGSESGSDNSRSKQGHSETDMFDMFSSFDQSHLNDVLPRNNSTEHNDVGVNNESEPLAGCRTLVKVAGVGHRYGQVGTSNSFQVWIENPSAGSLSVNVIGPRPHTVTETSIMYTGDNLYEVSYGVTQPGFYKIFIRWGNVEVPECPFICEVTM